MSSSYSYALWIKHLGFLSSHGLKNMPQSVLEFGPGSSLGTGLCALLSGANTYHALDAYSDTTPSGNLDLFEELVTLFQRRAPIEIKGWPDCTSILGEELFPHKVLTNSVLTESLSIERIDDIRRALVSDNGTSGEIQINYVSPQNKGRTIAPNSVDLIISHSVLEHVADLPEFYDKHSVMLKPGGWFSHQMDLESHGLASTWDGHWAYSDRIWKLVAGRRPYLINREPLSTHLRLLMQAGLSIEALLLNRREPQLTTRQLAHRWRSLSSEDRSCAGVFVQGKK